MSVRSLTIACAIGIAAMLGGCSRHCDHPPPPPSGSGGECPCPHECMGPHGHGPHGHGGHPHGPPPESFTACEGHEANAACTVTFGDWTLNDGVCMAPPPDSGETRLACVPRHHPPMGPGGPGGPPPGGPGGPPPPAQ